MTASFLEIVQTLASFGGALLAIPWMVAADLNLVTINRRNLNGNRRMIAVANVRLARGTIAIQMLLFLVGLATLFLAPPPYADVEDGLRSSIETDMIRSLFVTRLGMTAVSIWLMYVSYRSWLEERIPIQLVRRTDTTTMATDKLAAVAQEAASRAQNTATSAQDTASAVQIVATVAQDAATEAVAIATDDKDKTPV